MSIVDNIERGADAGVELLKYFGQWYTIKDDKGAYTFMRGEKADRVKIIIDERSSDTNRLFIELWASEELNRYGWAWTSDENILIYFSVPDTIFITRPESIREELSDWKGVFKTVKHRTARGFHRVGIPITEEVFSDVCEKVIRLD